MKKQTKVLIGLAAAGVGAYLIFKPKAAYANYTSKNPPSKTLAKAKENANVAAQAVSDSVKKRTSAVNQLLDIGIYTGGEVIGKYVGETPKKWWQKLFS